MTAAGKGAYKKGSQKGQGVVEYALLLGFAAVIAVGLIGSSNLQGSLEAIIEDMKEILNNSTFS